MYFVDALQDRIRKVNATSGIVSTVVDKAKVEASYGANANVGSGLAFHNSTNRLLFISGRYLVSTDTAGRRLTVIVDMIYAIPGPA
jgi:hypothetical protein